MHKPEMNLSLPLFFLLREENEEISLGEVLAKVGVDDCSTDLSLRGKPVFRGLIGPIPDGKGIARYESPEVFETLTKEWSKAQAKRRRRRRTAVQAEPAAPENV